MVRVAQSLSAAVVVQSGASATVFGGAIGPGRMANLDTTKTPPVAVSIYPWIDTTYMTGPAWVNVTHVMPTVTNGCTYSGGVWTYPAVPEDMVGVVRSAIATNNAFLALGNPTALQTENQVIAMTGQWTRWMLRRLGGQ